MSTPEDRGEPGRGRRHARPPSGDAGGQGAGGPGRPSGWPARYGPPPDFTLPPHTPRTHPRPAAPAERPSPPAPGPADSGWFTGPAEPPQPHRDRSSREATGSYGGVQPGGP